MNSSLQKKQFGDRSSAHFYAINCRVMSLLTHMQYCQSISVRCQGRYARRRHINRPAHLTTCWEFLQCATAPLSHFQVC